MLEAVVAAAGLPSVRQMSQAVEGNLLKRWEGGFWGFCSIGELPWGCFEAQSRESGHGMS